MSLLLVLLVLNVVLIQTPVIRGEYDAQRFRQIVTNDRTNDDAKDLTTVSCDQKKVRNCQGLFPPN